VPDHDAGGKDRLQRPSRPGAGGPARSAGGTDRTVGETLRRAREAKHLSLGELSAETRIGLPMLDALEKDHFDEIPSDTYVRGFLRSYAVAVGLDPQRILTQYSLQSGSTHTSRDDLWEVEEPVVESLSRPRSVSRYVVPALVAVILILVAVLVLRGGGGGDESPSPARGGAPEQVADAEHPAGPAGGEARGAPAGTDASGAGPRVPSGGEETPASVPPASLSVEEEQPAAVPDTTAPAVEEVPPAAAPPLRLVATVVDTTWVQLSVDGGEPLEFLLVTPGRTMTWEAQRYFLITLGNAGGLSLRLGDRDLGSLGPPGTVVRERRLDRSLLER
jgi:cytoskeleton protein RodZ